MPKPYNQEMRARDAALLRSQYEQWHAARRAARQRFRAQVQRWTGAGYTQAAITRALGISKQRLSQILRGD